MNINSLSLNTNKVSVCSVPSLSKVSSADNGVSNGKLLKLSDINSDNIKANFAPVSFKGNAPKIKSAYIITGEKDDLPLLVTKKNESYVVEFDSQTELIYGIDAINYLKQKDNFEYDTQVIFPKKAEGVLHIDGKDVPMPENSAVLINAGTDAAVETKKGFPAVIVSKKDFDWYERYGLDAKDINIKNKFLELMYYNSHLYNGEFTPNVFLPDEMRSDEFLSSIGIDKYKSRNNLVYDLYEKRDLLDSEKREEIERVKSLLDKLYQANMIVLKDDGYVAFNKYCDPLYQQKSFEEAGFTQEEIKQIMPSFLQARQVRMDSRYAIRNRADVYSPELIGKMKEKGLIYDNKKDADKYIYWKECFGNESSLLSRLSSLGFSAEEQNQILNNWKNINNTGFDISGLKFINDDVAVYNLNDKLNNWTCEKTNWVTNSTAIASAKGQTPFIGVSMVQTDEHRAFPMSEIRSEEKLHAHPNLEDKRQTEIYLVTSGAAALNVVKEGKSCIKLLKEGDLAIVGPGVSHCVNSILGEYEHIVAQVPSAFQYGFNFKSIVETPQDYDKEALEQKAIDMLYEYAGT